MVNRIPRINELIHREVSKIILRELEFPNALVTVSKVETSVDLGHSKVKISVIPSEKSQQVLQKLNRKIFLIQQMLNKRLNMRPVPKIKFEIDKTELKAQRIEEILGEINSKNPLSR